MASNTDEYGERLVNTWNATDGDMAQWVEKQFHPVVFGQGRPFYCRRGAGESLIPIQTGDVLQSYTLSNGQTPPRCFIVVKSYLKQVRMKVLDVDARRFTGSIVRSVDELYIYCYQRECSGSCPAHIALEAAEQHDFAQLQVERLLGTRSREDLDVYESRRVDYRVVPQDTSAPEPVYKVLIMGSFGCGKSSLLLRITTGQFPSEFASTLKMDFRYHRVEIDGERAKMQIWDTAGQERQQAVMGAYLRGAQGLVLLYDITELASFNKIRDWHALAMEHSSDIAQVVLVGHKSDLSPHRRVVETEQGQALARDLGDVPFFEASSKTGAKVDEIFGALGNGLLKKKVKGKGTHAQRITDLNDRRDEKEPCCPWWFFKS